MPKTQRKTPPLRSDASPAVAQTCRDAIDREVDALDDPTGLIARTTALNQLHLQVVERVAAGEAVLDDPRQQRVAIDQPVLLGHGEPHLDRGLQFLAQARNDGRTGACRQPDLDLQFLAQARNDGPTQPPIRRAIRTLNQPVGR